MIFKKLLQKFDISDMPIEDKLKLAKNITKKFDFKICEQLSDDELKVTIQAILFIIFVSHGMSPTAGLFFSKILAEIIFNKIKKAEDSFGYLKAKFMSEWYEIQDFSEYCVEVWYFQGKLTVL